VQPQKQHRRQAVPAGCRIVDHVLLADQQRLVVHGGEEESAVFPIGETRQDLIGQTDGLVEPCRRAVGLVQRQ
jgi:hypothetical protein